MACNDVACIGCNHQLFVGGDDNYLHRRVASADESHYAAQSVVQLLVYIHAHEGKVVGNRFAGEGLVFAYAARKYDDVYTIEGCDV